MSPIDDIDGQSFDIRNGTVGSRPSISAGTRRLSELLKPRVLRLKS